MRIHHELKYDATPDEVHAMLADPAFRERVCEAQHVNSSDVTITPKGDGMTVVVDQKRPTDGIPGFALKFVGDQIHILQKEEWSSTEQAALDVSIPGKPGHLKGTVRLAGDGAATVQTVEGELKVHIPLVGGKLEKLIADLLASALRAEQRVGTAWLAGDR
ncbi:MAG TPA: DUF2505 domain-containing protein [Nocardioidaceae bacterium]|jgi:hypothetical protein|nr:DUF2505 domain-containing protein [Nocardioidaceae bacterium]